MTTFTLFHRPRHFPRWASIALLVVGIACILAAGWIQTARDGYRVGASEVYPVAYRQGVADGFSAGQREAFKGCTPWGKWQDRRVVICREITK